MATATLGGVPLTFDPDEVSWDFKIKAAVQSTIGGRVIQVYGTDLGDMTMLGQFGMGDRSKGDEAGWEAAERFMADVTRMVKRVADDYDADPVRLRVPVMDWNFLVYVKSISPVEHDVKTISPVFRVTLFIVEDLTGKVTRGIVDKYIERLLKGIGWVQSEYNGPTAEEVEAILAPYGGSVANYIEGQFIQTFSEAMGGTLMGTAGGGAVVSGPEGINAYLWALRMQESGGDYTVVNPIGAAGAYQYLRSTWNNYKGYSTADQAPPEVQDERAAIDANRAYDRYHTWEAAASIHYSGAWWPPGSPQRNYPQPSGPTIGEYINSIMAKMGQYPGGTP